MTNYLTAATPVILGFAGGLLWTLWSLLWDKCIGDPHVTRQQFAEADRAAAILPSHHQGQLDSLAKHTALNNVELNGLDERVSKLECGDDLFTPTPYSSGRPCPKPTKDLRPGDEVSIRVRVTNVGETNMTVASATAEPDAPGYYRALMWPTPEQLDKIRTDK